MEPTPWMTTTGAILLAISGGLGAASQVIPKETWRPWLLAISIFLGTTAAALMGQGIRRNIPTMRTSGRSETLTESRAGMTDQPKKGGRMI